MADVEPIVGRYLRLGLDGRPHRLYFEEAGQGIPLVCLHTAGADGRQFRHLMNDAEIIRHFRLLAFDMPWHGKSLPPEGWEREDYRLTTASYTEMIVAFCRALALDRPVVMGCSIGGRIVLNLAIEHAAMFRALIGPQSPATARNETLCMYKQGGPGVFKGDLYFYRVDGDLRGKVGAIDTGVCPLYLLTGEYDFSCTPADTERTAGQIKGAEVTVMRGLGHFPMSENPKQFRGYIMPV